MNTLFKINKFKRKALADVVLITIASFSIVLTVHSAEIAIPTAPLITSTSVDPNMMLFIDSSGSMNYIVEDSEQYDPDTYAYNCSNPLTYNEDKAIRIIIDNTSTNSPKAFFSYNILNDDFGTMYDFGTSSQPGITNRTEKCFDDDTDYVAVLYALSDYGSDFTYAPFGYDGATYPGKFLNWYFDGSNFSSGERQRDDTSTRIEVARDAAIDLIEGLSDIRVGISIFDTSKSDAGDDDNDSNGVRILANIVDVDEGNNKIDLQNIIGDIDASGGTPIAEAMQELGRYFSIGYSSSSKITIHPDTAQSSSHKVQDVFKKSPEFDGSSSSVSNPGEVITEWCQQNFIVAMTDGIPSGDTSNISSYLEDYDNDCTSSTCDDDDKKKSGGYNYNSSGSDYADDVILAMHDIDLRPDLNNSDGDAVKNNVTTYMVGFAEEFLKDDPFMADMAAAGGGGPLLSAINSSELAVAFKAATDSIFAKVATGSGLSFNSANLGTTSRVYSSNFNSSDWTGNVLAFEILSDGSIVNNAKWDAASKLDAMNYKERNIFTYNNDDGVKKGVRFVRHKLGAAVFDDVKKDPEDIQDKTISDDVGSKRVISYIWGDRTYDGINGYRDRTSILGDIVNSTLVYVGTPQLSWPDYNASSTVKFGSSTKKYSTFKNDNANRTPMLYVGANDGMLHGFNASEGNDGGREEFAYIPSLLASSEERKGLHYLVDEDYDHKFYVDQTPIVSDVYTDGDWRSILVGSLGAGGKGLFVLDITDPKQFDYSDINAEGLALWEFGEGDDADFGYSYARPTVTMMANGKWAIVVGNGYNNSGDGKAKLFIIYIEKNKANDGTLSFDYVKIDTGVGSTGQPNGLSSPRVVDLDGDSIADRIYAGDLEGNMWAFDVDSSSSSQWGVAYKNGNTPKPLFIAKDSNNNAQPITSIPIVARNNNTVSTSSDDPNLLVFFGTGKYLELSDHTSFDVMSYYGVLDDNSGDKDRNDLTERKIITNDNAGIRVISGDSIDWPNTDGWYFDFVHREKEDASNNDIEQRGERVILSSYISNDVLLVPTNIPNLNSADQCVSNSDSWLMGVDLNTGKAPISYAIFDINNDGNFDSNDTTSNYDIDADGSVVKGEFNTATSGDTAAAGGVKSKVGGYAGDLTFSNDLAFGNSIDSDAPNAPSADGAEDFNDNGETKVGRLSWEELFRY